MSATIFTTDTMHRPYLDTRAAAEYLCLSERTLRNWRYRRQGPRAINLGRRIVYAITDLDAWVQRRARTHR